MTWARILGLSLQGQPRQGVLGWQSASSHNYIIEAASNPKGPWTSLGSAVPGAGDATQATINLPASEPQRFYRIRLAQ